MMTPPSNNSRQKDKRSRLKRAILGSISTAGLIPAGMVAPQVTGALAKSGLIEREKFKESRIERSLKTLAKEGLVEFRTGARGKKYMALTKRGEQYLNRLEIMNWKLTEPPRWDGKWRVIIFDIEERKRKSRDQLRYVLESIGFVRLQNSVWIYPYDCEDLIILLKADLELGRTLLYMIVEEMENDTALKLRFNLPLS